MYETYRRGFVYGDLGASAAMLWVMLLIVFAVIGFEFFPVARTSIELAEDSKHDRTD